jgi:hypothetical protein
MHIGKKIRTVMRSQGRSVSWLAAQIPCDRSNIYNIYKRDTIDVKLLMRLSVILGHNFLDDLSREMESDKSVLK